MNHITADDLLVERLGNLFEPVEIRDETGKLMGHYTPVCSPEEQALYERAKQHFDPIEMARRLKEERGQGVPLAEIWKRLGVQPKQ